MRKDGVAESPVTWAALDRFFYKRLPNFATNREAADSGPFPLADVRALTHLMAKAQVLEVVKTEMSGRPQRLYQNSYRYVESRHRKHL